MRRTRLVFFLIVGVALAIVVVSRWPTIEWPIERKAVTSPTMAMPSPYRNAAMLLDQRATPLEEPLSAEVRDVIPVYTSIGSVYFVGEIVNTGRRPLAKPEVIISLQDEEGRRIAFETGYTIHDLVLPEDRVPVAVLFSDPPLDWRSFEVFLQAKPATGREFMSYTEFVGEGTTISKDDYGRFVVSGQVKNVGSSGVEFLQAVVSLYGQDNKIVGMGSAYAERSTLDVGESSPFSVRVMNVAAAPFSYRVQFVGHAK